MSTLSDSMATTVSVKNAAINLHGNYNAAGLFRFSCIGVSGNDAATAGDCNVLVLDTGSQVRAKAFYRKGGARAHVLFRGGQLQHLWGGTSENKPFFLENADKGVFEFDADTAAIAIDTHTNVIDLLSDCSSPATTLFSGTHGFAKRGSGKLTLNNPGNKAVSTMTGGVLVEEGTLALGADCFFGQANALGVAMEATFDLGGKSAVFASVSGLGAVVSSTDGGVLTVGGDDSDSTFGQAIGAGMTLVKEGAGTLSMATSWQECDLVAREGTVSLANAQPRGYKHYRFKIDRLYGTGTGKNPTGMQISEFKLLNGVTDITGRRSGLSYAEYRRSQTPDPEKDTNYYWEIVTYAVDGDTGSKWNDYRGRDSRIEAEGQDLYVQIDYAVPTLATGYSWATANDGGPNGDGRDPSAWRLLASDDGETWVELDKRENMGPYEARKTWVGEFAITYPADRYNRKLGHVVVEQGATLDVRGGAFACASLVNHGGTILTDANTPVSLHSDEGEDVVFDADGSAYAGDVAKDGAGTNTVVGVWSVTGNVSVAEGTMRCLAAGFGGKYFRLTITENKSDPNAVQFAELYLYGKDGAVFDDGRPFSRANAGTEPSELSACQVSLKKSYASVSSNEGIERAFDGSVFVGNSVSKYCCAQRPSPSEPIVIHFRVSDNAPRVFGYNFAAANDTNGARHPACWTLEGSHDGVAWRILDEQNWPDTPNANSTPSATVYLNPIPYATANVDDASADALYPFGDSAVVSVDSDATLDFYSSNMRIAALAVDGDAGTGGTITRFTPAASGALYLTLAGSVETFIGDSGAELLNVPEIDEPRNLRNWQVYVNGVLDGKIVPKWANGKLMLVNRLGMILVVF